MLNVCVVLEYQNLKMRGREGNVKKCGGEGRGMQGSRGWMGLEDARGSILRQYLHISLVRAISCPWNDDPRVCGRLRLLRHQWLERGVYWP